MRLTVAVLLCSVCLVSCVNTRKSVYFNQNGDVEFADTLSVPSTIIQKNDLLNITVSTVNPELAVAFNAPNVSYANTTNYNGASVTASGYLVNTEGNIIFPVLNAIRAEGLTELELQQKITRTLIDRKLLLDPIVSIRHLNFKVTVLGEVAHPLVINVPNERISLLEALGLAGDITIFGKRDRVLVIREEKGKKIFKRLDLNSSMLMNTSYYYLRPNDVVYVEPNKTKVANSGRAVIWLPTVLSGLSFLAIIIDRATR